MLYYVSGSKWIFPEQESYLYFIFRGKGKKKVGISVTKISSNREYESVDNYSTYSPRKNKLTCKINQEAYTTVSALTTNAEEFECNEKQILKGGNIYFICSFSLKSMKSFIFTNTLYDFSLFYIPKYRYINNLIVLIEINTYCITTFLI